MERNNVMKQSKTGEKNRKREKQLYIIMYIITYFIDDCIYTRLAFNVNNHAIFQKFHLTPPPAP